MRKKQISISCEFFSRIRLTERARFKTERTRCTIKGMKCFVLRLYGLFWKGLRVISSDKGSIQRGG